MAAFLSATAAMAEITEDERQKAEAVVRDVIDEIILKDAVAKYLYCAKLAAKELDDRVTGADVLADAVAIQCREVFVSNLYILGKGGRNADPLLASMRPFLIETVLTVRRARRALDKPPPVPATSKPKKPNT